MIKDDQGEGELRVRPTAGTLPAHYHATAGAVQVPIGSYQLVCAPLQDTKLQLVGL